MLEGGELTRDWSIIKLPSVAEHGEVELIIGGELTTGRSTSIKRRDGSQVVVALIERESTWKWRARRQAGAGQAVRVGVVALFWLKVMRTVVGAYEVIVDIIFVEVNIEELLRHRRRDPTCSIASLPTGVELVYEMKHIGRILDVVESR